MKFVELSIIGENGKRLPGVLHKGRLHVAGEQGERYKLRLRNTTHERVEVVLTVDGRDILSGEVGTKDNRGYVLNPLETTDIEGWRTSDDHVAAFRFGADKDKAYSTQMGTGQHLGVIGMVVFREKVKHTYVPFPIRPLTAEDPVWPNNPFQWPNIQPTWVGVNSGGTYGATTHEVNCSTNSTPGERARGILRSMSVEPPREDVQLGTEFGEQISAAVSTTSFNRFNKEPQQTVTVEYDTAVNLRKKGVPIDRALSSKEGPSAFPGDDPRVKDNGYCKPPSR